MVRTREEADDPQCEKGATVHYGDGPERPEACQQKSRSNDEEENGERNFFQRRLRSSKAWRLLIQPFILELAARLPTE